MSRPSTYLLGSSDAEWARLARQHALWGPALLEVLRAHGVGRGARILEVGCGPGLLLHDLVELAGPDGRAVGLELDADSARRAREAGHEVRTGDLLTSELGGPWDAIVARWVLSFVGDATEPVRRMAHALGPDGVLVIQDYDHDGLRLHPQEPVVERVIAAMRRAYAARGGDLWVGLQLPGALKAAGLQVEACTPWVRAGHPSSEVARWFRDFCVLHASTFVAHGGLDPADARAFESVWDAVSARSDALFVSPMQIVAVGRR